MASPLLSNLSLMTCQILTKGPGTRSGAGTGFFLGAQGDGQATLLLVTNRHVVEGVDDIVLKFNLGDASGQAKLGTYYTMNCGKLQDGVVYHPGDVDLAAIAVGGLIEQIRQEGFYPIYRGATLNDLPSDADGFGLAEDIFMVGYPIGLSDKLNNRPIVRRGITATDYAIDYEGKPEFMIDAACFPGSSGSPIVVANNGAYSTSDGIMTVGTRFKLLGVLWGGPQFNAAGHIRPAPVPTAGGDMVTTQVMVHLGYCIKARELRTLFAAALKRWG